MTTQVAPSIYDRPAAEILAEEKAVIIRASQATSCQRQLYYAALEEPQTDAIPPEAIARMEMGKALEPVVLDLLRMRGWAIMPKPDYQDEEDAVQYVLLDSKDGKEIEEVVMSGIPDAMGYPPKHEGDGVQSPVVIEVKTRDNNFFRNVKQRGNWVVMFGAVVQLAFYREAMIQATADAEDRDLAVPGQDYKYDSTTDSCIVTMNKGDGELHIEWFRPEVLDEALEIASAQLRHKVDNWMAGDDPDGIPPKDYTPGSWQCNSCQWRTKCGNTEKEAEIDLSGEKISEEEVMAAFADWEPAKLAEVAVDKDLSDYTRAIALRYCLGLGVEKASVVGNEFNWNLTVRANENVALNHELVRYYLSPEQYEECLEIKRGQPFVQIRKGKRL